ncbi:MAG: glycoside hydrolase family 2, partial [Sphingomonas sp.]
IVAPSGQVVHRVEQPVAIPAGGTVTPDRSARIARPTLWSPDTPALYRLEERLSVAGRTVDTRSTRFGVRTVTIDAANGLRINGTRVLLRGGNIHHDNYMLGAAGWPRADARKVALMKAAGYNAIRSAHNPASQALLDAADRLGMLVIDEAFDAWSVSKRDEDYARFYAADWRSDLRSLVVRARNHPSIIMWSIGNEIPEQNRALGWNEGAAMAAEVRRLDPIRPVTQAVSEDGTRVDPAYANLDAAGYNYRAHLYAGDHLRMPKRVMYGSESFPANAYDYWAPIATMPWVLGDFVWTAIDYLGEASIGWTGYSNDWKKIGPYPWHLAYCGEIDATGRRLPGSYYRQMIWNPATPAVAAFVRWP